MNTSLRKQQLIYAAALILGVLAFGVITYFASNPLDFRSKIQVNSGKVTNLDGTELTSFNYAEEVKIVTDSVISERGNLIYIPASGQLVIQQFEDKYYLYLTNGIAFIQPQADLSVSSGGELVNLMNSEVVYHHSDDNLFVAKGSVNFKEIALSINMNLIAGKSIPIDRAKINANSDWQKLIALLTQQNKLPESLSDFTAPVIQLGEVPTATDEKTLQLEGKTEIDAVLSLNGNKITADGEGEFVLALNLSSGENKFTLLSEDKWGNVATEEFTINYPKTAAADSNDCTAGSLASQVFCTINTYRESKNLEKLTATTETGTKIEITTTNQTTAASVFEELLINHKALMESTTATKLNATLNTQDSKLAITFI